MDDTTKCKLVEADLSIALFGDNTIEFKGQKFVPDDSKGYFQFSLSHSFPVQTFYGTSLYPGVIARSYASMLHQNLNWEHQLNHYHKQPGKPSHIDDRVIGAILAVDFPNAPAAGWRVQGDPSKAPGITGVAVYYKLAQGMSKIIGEHQGGRHKYTVSMEVDYRFSQSGFAVKRDGKPDKAFASSTPGDLADMGWDYSPWEGAPEDLLATFSAKKNRIAGKYNGRDTVLMMGGIDGSVHYLGVGLVKYGAEPTASIRRMTASASDLIVDPFESLAELFGSVLVKK